MVSSIRFRPRQSRPCDGGQSNVGGGCIACDRNEEEECCALAAIKPTNGAKWPEKGRDGAAMNGGRECCSLIEMMRQRSCGSAHRAAGKSLYGRVHLPGDRQCSQPRARKRSPIQAGEH